MGVDLGALVRRIPQDKLNDIVNGLAEGATARQLVESLGAAGVEATEEEARALMGSLLLNDGESGLDDDELDRVAGGVEDHDGWNWRRISGPDGDIWVWYSCPNCHM